MINEYRLGKTIWHHDSGINTHFICDEIWLGNLVLSTQNLIDMGSVPVEDKCEHAFSGWNVSCGRCIKCDKFIEAKQDKCEEIELIRAYPHCKHPEYPTNVIVNKVNELITAFNNHIKGER